MITFLVLTGVLFLFFMLLFGLGKRQEVMANWSKYRASPLYMLSAFLYKPPDDPRSRFQFTQDNFNEVMQSLARDAFKAGMAPLMDIFQLTGGGIVGSAAGMRSARNVMGTMMDSFDTIFSVFEKRFQATLFRLSMTFQTLQTSMARVWGIAANSIYMGMSTVSSILSTLDLIMKIVIIILVILVAIVFFLFLFMFPLIPVILTVIGIITTAGAGAAVGGMASAFCFAEGTPVVMANGSTKPIERVAIGETLADGGKVTGTMEFQQECRNQLYSLQGIHVTGSHIVWLPEGNPAHVADHPDSVPLVLPASPRLFCLNTTTHRIPVRPGDASDPLLFADWEELDEDTEQQMEWNRFVHTQLNPGAPWLPERAITQEEAAFHPATQVLMPMQTHIAMEHLRPGMIVLDASWQPTRVLGIVKLASTEVKSVTGAISAAVWRQKAPRGAWEQGHTRISAPAHKGAWYSVITESGTFRLLTGEAVRDFTDVGMGAIEESYEWVLEALVSKNPRAL